MQIKTKRTISRVFTAIFVISQFYWLYWIGVGVFNFHFGIDSGWLIPSLSSHRTIYGFDTIIDSLAMAIVVTILSPFIIIPIYQIGFLIVMIVKKIKRKVTKPEL